jgi:hypothetical protein
MRIAIYTTVVRVENRVSKKYSHGVGENAVFTDTSLGYYVVFDGSHEAIHVGYEPPDFRTGDRVKITFERV